MEKKRSLPSSSYQLKLYACDQEDLTKKFTLPHTSPVSSSLPTHPLKKKMNCTMNSLLALTGGVAWRGASKRG